MSLAHVLTASKFCIPALATQACIDHPHRMLLPTSTGPWVLLMFMLITGSAGFMKSRDDPYDPTLMGKAGSVDSKTLPTPMRKQGVSTPSHTPTKSLHGAVHHKKQELAETAPAPTAFIDCRLYHVPHAPGQAGLNSVCSCDGSTFDLSFATSGTTSTWCGYTAKPDAALQIQIPNTTEVISPAATPAGTGNLNVLALQWCPTGSNTCDGAIRFLRTAISIATGSIRRTFRTCSQWTRTE